MRKEVYDYMVKDATRDCVRQGFSVEKFVYDLSCQNNKAWRLGESCELTNLNKGMEHYVCSLMKIMLSKHL